MKIFHHLTSPVATNLLLALGATLTGCGDKCADTVCVPCTRTENLSVSLDTRTQPGGFTGAEVAGAYVVRFAPPGFTTPLDTLRAGLCDASLHCHFDLQTYPIPGVAGWQHSLAYTTYNYRFVLPRAGRTYDLSNLDVQSQPAGPGCCSCASNVRRRALLNGVPVADDGGGEGNGILLRR